MSQPLFTVATITYNSSKWVRQAIESVLASSYTDFEYIISDDCSTDDTWEIIKKYNDPRIRSWQNDSNIGEYPNRNKALYEATGEYIFFIDGDDVLYKHTLRNLSEYIIEFPNAGMIWGVLTPLNNYAILPYEFSSKSILKLVFNYKNLISIIGFSETVFKTDHLLQIGGFNEKLKMGDIYIRKKVLLKSSVLLVPLGLSYWRQNSKQASKTILNNYLNISEAFLIENLILNDPDIPLNEKEVKIFRKYVRSSFLRRIIFQFLFKLKIRTFFKLLRSSKLNFVDFLYLNYRLDIDKESLPVSDISEPVFNDFNFIKNA